MSTFSRTRMRAARERARLSRGALARRTGRSDSHIIKIETGAVTPSMDTLCRIATACGVSAGEFFTSDGESHTQLGGAA